MERYVPGSSATRHQLCGVIPPVVTLFDRNGLIDEAANGRLVDYLIDGGVDGLFFLGTTGEAVHLSIAERKALAAWAVEYVAGRVPVLIGTGLPGTAQTIELTEHASQIGADAAVIVSPYFSVPSDRQLLAHYGAIAEAVAIPQLIYNIPSCTGKSLAPSLVAELAGRYPNIAGIKNSSDSISHMRAMIAETKAANPAFAVFCGHDELIPAALMLGADGAVPSTANMNPGLLVLLYQQVRDGDLPGASRSAQMLARLVEFYSLETGTPAVIKTVLQIRGIVDNPAVRLPSLPLTREAREKLIMLLRQEKMLV